MRDLASRRSDEGFTLVEVLVSLSVMTVVLTSVTVFLVNSVRTSHGSSLRDTAAQLVVDGMEKARGMRGSALLSGRRACTATCASVGGTVANLLGAGAQRWDAADSTTTLALPSPGPQADGSVVTDPAQPEVMQLDGLTFQRYYHVAKCWQPAVSTTVTAVSCAPAADAAELVRVVVAVTWSGADCSGGTCTYASVALFSASPTDPYIEG